MKRFISLALASMLMLSAFAACTQPAETESSATESSATTSSETDVSEESAGESTEESSGEATSANTMTFYNGEMELPTEFDNFVVMDFSLVDSFTALGYAPTYGSTAEVADSRYYHYFQRAFGDFDLNQITHVSSKNDTFMEELISYAPDFIIVTESAEKELGKYEAIAPTYVFPTITDVPEDSATWKEEFKFIGEFVGETEKAEQMLADYDTLVETSRATVADEIEGKTALVVQLNEKGFKIRMPEDQASVYADIGFLVPEGLDSSFASTSVSNEDGSFPVETIVEFNPDYILIHNQSVENYNALVGTPIWENISAVQNGRIYETTQSAWNHLNGYLANTCRLNDLVYFITEDKQVLPESVTIE